MPCFQFLNIWHFLFNFFRIHFFLTFIFWKKNSTSCKKTCRSYFNQKWFWILYNEFFLQIFYFVVLFSHTGFNQLMSQGLFCKEPVVWHWCWVRHKIYYYSFKIFFRSWLAKSTRLIHHKQFLMTKFGRILCLARNWRQKCSVLSG